MSDNPNLPVPALARPIKGKTPKRIRHKNAIEKAEMLAARNLHRHIGLLMELAAGVLVAEEGKDGEEKVYRTPPDRLASQFLVEVGMGKPVDRKEITGELAGQLFVTPWMPESKGNCCK